MKKIKKIHNHFEEEKSILFEAISEFQKGREDYATLIYKMSKQYTYSVIYHQAMKFMDQNIIFGDAKSIVEDVMQELYMEFFKTISTFRNEDPNSFYKWIMVVSNRMVLRYVDKNKMEVLQKELHQEYGDEYDIKTSIDIADDEESNPEFVPDAALEKKEFQRLMKKFIKKLPKEQADTIVYHIYGGLKYQEIADIMGVSLITVKTRMRKAKDALREMISDYEKKTGTQLMSVAPLPLIAFYLRAYMERSKLPMSMDFKLFQQIRKYVGESVSTLSRYIEALTEVNGVKEMVVGVVVATVVSTGTVEVVRHNIPTTPEPTPIVEEQKEDKKKEQEPITSVEEQKEESVNDESAKEEVKQEETKQETVRRPAANGAYFIYWDSKTIDVSYYVHQGSYYKDPTYGRMRKWLICEDVLLQLPFTRKVVDGTNVYCYDDGTEKCEFVIHGTNSYTINGVPYTMEMEVEEIDGKKYINPYHLFQNMFGMANFSVGGSYSANYVAIKTTQYQQSTASVQSSLKNGSTIASGNQTQADTIMGNISNETSSPISYEYGDSYARERFKSLTEYLKVQPGGDSLVAGRHSLTYFDSIYVSYKNDDNAWMYLRLSKWTTNAKPTNNLEDQVYMSLNITLSSIMGTIADGSGAQLYQKVKALLDQYYYPQNIPTQGVVEEDIPGLYVTLTQSPDGLEIRYFAE